MVTTQYLITNFNTQAIPFALARIIYRAAWGLSGDCDRILPAWRWLLQLILWTGSALPVVGLVVALGVLPVFCFITWPQVVS